MSIPAFGIRLFYIDGPLVKRSRRRPLTPQTGVRFSHGSPRRNGLHSIQKAQPFGWAFLIPFRHSSLSPQNFAWQTFAGAPLPEANGTPAEWTTFHSKSPAIRLGFFHTIPSFLLIPTKLCVANFCGGPAAGGQRHPGRMDCIPFKKRAKRLGFFHTISSFLLLPTKLCKANFCGGPASEKVDVHLGRVDCIPFENSTK